MFAIITVALVASFVPAVQAGELVYAGHDDVPVIHEAGQQPAWWSWTTRVWMSFGSPNTLAVQTAGNYVCVLEALPAAGPRCADWSSGPAPAFVPLPLPAGEVAEDIALGLAPNGAPQLYALTTSGEVLHYLRAVGWETMPFAPQTPVGGQFHDVALSGFGDGGFCVAETLHPGGLNRLECLTAGTPIFSWATANNDTYVELVGLVAGIDTACVDFGNPSPTAITPRCFNAGVGAEFSVPADQRPDLATTVVSPGFISDEYAWVEELPTGGWRLVMLNLKTGDFYVSPLEITNPADFPFLGDHNGSFEVAPSDPGSWITPPFWVDLSGTIRTLAADGAPAPFPWAL